MKKRVFAIVLSLVMCLGVLLITADADQQTYGAATAAELTEKISTAQSGDTVQLTGDIALTGTVTVPSGKTLTLDLNGYTVSNGTVKSGYLLKNEGTLYLKNGTVTDNRTNVKGTITAIDNIGTLDLNDVTVSREYGIAVKNDEKSGVGGTLTVTNSVLSAGTYEANVGQAIQNWGAATITGGTFNGRVTAWAYDGCSSGNTTINGGTFNGAVQSLQWANSETWPTTAAATTINGGTFTDTIAVCYQTGGSQPTVGTEKPENATAAVITINGGTFSDLSGIPYCAANATYTLGADVTLTSRVEPSFTGTIDLGGHTVSSTAACGNGSAFDVKGGTVTIQNGTIDGTAVTETECDAITVRSGATANLESLTVNINSKNGACAYAFEGGRVNVKSGTYTNSTTEIYQYNSAFKGMLVNQANVAEQLVFVTGGTFNGQNPATGDDAQLATTFLGEGYQSVETNGAWTVSELPAVAKIGSKGYASLAEAIESVEDSTPTTITMLADVEGAHGISVPGGRNITVDFDGHTYSVEKPGAGSAKTQTQAFQLLEGSDITFKNGTISCTADNKEFTWASTDTVKGVAMVIQNYANLTLDNMTIDGTNIAHNGSPSTARYIISNNSGNVTIKDSEIIAGSVDFAFDSCKYSTSTRDYPKPTVTVTGSTVNGKVEITGGDVVLNEGTTVNHQIRLGEAAANGASGGTLTVNGADVNGDATDQGAIKVFGENTLVVNSGNITGYYYGITGNGKTGYGGTTIIINGGTIKGLAANDNAGIYHPQSGTLTINGGTIEGATGIYTKSGTVTTTINAGTITGNGDQQAYQTAKSGFYSTGDAFLLDNCDYPGGAPNASIAGGTFNSTNAAAVASYAKSGKEPVTGFITGGTFSTEPDEAYLADGYAALQSDAVWKVGKKQVAVEPDNSFNAEVSGSTTAETVKTAVAALADKANISSFVVDTDAAVTKSTITNAKSGLETDSITSFTVDLKVKPTAATAADAGITKVVYDVTPVANYVCSSGEGSAELHTLEKSITFRLPVPATWGSYAKVCHGSQSLGILDIHGDAESGCYVEVSSKTYSEFSAEKTDETPEYLVKVGDTSYTAAHMQEAIDAAVSNGQNLVLLTAVTFENVPNYAELVIPDGTLKVDRTTNQYAFTIFDETEYTEVDPSGDEFTVTATITSDSTVDDNTTENILEVAPGNTLTITFTASQTIYGAIIELTPDENFTVTAAGDWKDPDGDGTYTYDAYEECTIPGITLTAKDVVANEVVPVSASGEFTLDETGLLGDAANVNVTFNGQTVTIYNKQFTVSNMTDDFTYDGTAKTTANEVTAEGGTYTIEYSSDNITYTSAKPSFTDADDYTVYYRASGTGYQSVSGSWSVKIKQAQAVISNISIADNAEITYDGAAHAVTATTNFGTLAITYTKNGESFTGTPTATGSYVATLTVAGTDNWEGASETVNYTIAKPAYAVKVTQFITGYQMVLVSTASDLHWTYDGHPMYDVTELGYQLVNGEYVLRGAAGYTGTPTGTKVYAYIVAGTANEAKVDVDTVVNPAVSFTLSSITMKQGTREYDVNISAKVDLSDAVVAQNVLNGNAAFFGSNLLSRYGYVLRADVNRDGVVDTDDAADVKADYKA